MNVRGIQSNLDKIKVLLDDFYESNDSFFDVLMFSETWLTELTTSQVELENYYVFHSVRTIAVHGGVSLFIRKNVNLSDIKVIATDFQEKKWETLINWLNFLMIFQFVCLLHTDHQLLILRHQSY